MLVTFCSFVEIVSSMVWELIKRRKEGGRNMGKERENEFEDRLFLIQAAIGIPLCLTLFALTIFYKSSFWFWILIISIIAINFTSSMIWAHKTTNSHYDSR